MSRIFELGGRTRARTVVVVVVVLAESLMDSWCDSAGRVPLLGWAPLGARCKVQGARHNAVTLRFLQAESSGSLVTFS